jgi:hypothetical protein
MTTAVIQEYELLYALDEAMMQRRYSLYRQLHETQPRIFWSERLQRWICTRYAEIKAALRDPRLSNEQPSSALQQLPEEIRNALTLENPLFRQANKIMMSRDDPDHARLRSLVSKAFTPRVIELQHPRMQQLARDLLERMGQQEQPDFIRDFATPFPIMIIAAMIGIPCEDSGQIKRWSDAGADFVAKGAENLETLFGIAVTASEFNEFLHPYIEARRKQPQDDLLSAFIRAESRGDTLSVDELVANTFLLLAAGNETTTNLLGNGLWTLLNHRDQLELLREHPEFIDAAVEEILRYESPSQTTGRRAQTALEIAGQHISPDEVVTCVLGAANRDPEQFTDPDCFTIARQDNKHIAFGLGPHYCLGAPLARLEAQIALPLLLERYPAISLASTHAHWRKNPTFLGLEHLPVTLV